MALRTWAEGSGTTQEPEERTIKRRGRNNPRTKKNKAEGTQEPQGCLLFVERDGDEDDEDVCKNISYHVFGLWSFQRKSSNSEPF